MNTKTTKGVLANLTFTVGQLEEIKSNINDENAPFAEGGFSLLRSDFQKFMKRLRKHAKSTKIKYYACGEYGTNYTERPHYHAIVFNLPRPFDKYITKAWKYGHIHVGTVTA